MQPLDVVTRRPFNAETPWTGLLPSVTPTEHFFVRNHFDEPALPLDTYHVRVFGTRGDRPKAFTMPQLQALPQHKVTCLLECAGNGRARMVPKPPGTPWGDRAVACATWEGPALADVLAQAPPEEGAVEVLFQGADIGVEDGVVAHFERSLPLPAAMRPAEEGGPILALRMNGQPLPRSHGAPLRLLVPGWYGVASVKWLTVLKYLDRPFKGFFQRSKYVWDDGSVVGAMRPKAMMLRPHPGEPLGAGPVLLEGRAWGGEGGIAKVEAQVDDGPWREARLDPLPDAAHAGAWQAWRLEVALEEGTRRVRVRATDAAGRQQPLEPVVNRLGYGYNTAEAVELLVGPAAGH